MLYLQKVLYMLYIKQPKIRWVIRGWSLPAKMFSLNQKLSFISNLSISQLGHNTLVTSLMNDVTEKLIQKCSQQQQLLPVDEPWTPRRPVGKVLHGQRSWVKPRPDSWTLVERRTRLPCCGVPLDSRWILEKGKSKCCVTFILLCHFTSKAWGEKSFSSFQLFGN